MAAKKQVPIVEGLFTWPSDRPRLKATRCRRCGTVAFPKAPFCPNPYCDKARENMEDIELSSRGTLWTWTTQIYAPPAPFRMEPFKAYGIGMIDTEEGVRVLGILATTDDLKMGIPLEMTTDTLYEDEENQYITWVWKPVS